MTGKKIRAVLLDILYMIVAIPIGILTWVLVIFLCCLPLYPFRLCCRSCWKTEDFLDPNSRGAWTLYLDFCGFLLMYNVGVMKYLEEKGLLESCHFYCVSGGNIAALLYLAGYDINSDDELREMFNILGEEKSKAMACGWCGDELWVKDTLERILPDDIVERVRGRFSVGYT